MDNSPTILMPSSLQTPQPQEQNGILDWLRKLRLHKYYPVFKQLTMEKVCWLLRGSHKGLGVPLVACALSSFLEGPSKAFRRHNMEELGW